MALHTQKDWADGWSGKAMVAEARHDFDKAIEYMKNDLPSRPDNFSGDYRLGEYYLELGEPDEAINYLNLELERKSDLARLTLKAEALLRLGKEDEVIATLDEGMQIHLEYLDSHIGKTIILQRRDQHHEAIVLIDKALAIKSNEIKLCEDENSVSCGLQLIGEAKVLLVEVEEKFKDRG